jgi:hypothetical protein
MDMEMAIIEKYLAQLNASEKIAYDIAISKLESSFDIEKSIGYQEFKKEEEVARQRGES